MVLLNLSGLWISTRVDVPRAPRFLASIIASLHYDLRFAPDEIKRRQMHDAEMLMRDVQFDRLYPMEYVVFRITRFRPEGDWLDATMVGRALIRDLGTFIQALSSEVDMGADQPRGHAISLDKVAEKLSVNRRTVQRYRGDGLALHWVRETGDHPYLGCFPDALEHYLERSPEGMRKATAWNRINAAEKKKITDRARTLHASQDLSLHAASVVIAKESRRAVSTIRHVLQRFDRSSSSPIFSEHGPLTDHDAEVCQRAHGMGVPIVKAANHFGKSVPAVHRAMLRYRKKRLATLSYHSVWLKTFDRNDASQVLLEQPGVLEGLPGPDTTIDLAAETRSIFVDDAERMVAASHLLIGRAQKRLVQTSGQPTSHEIDLIESDLRWAGRIQGRMLLHVLPVILNSCQQWLGRPVSELSRRGAFELVNSCMKSIWPVISTLEPRMAGRLESRCQSAVDRLLATRQSPDGLRASAQHAPGQMMITWPVGSLVDWSWLEPLPEWAIRVVNLTPEARELIQMRWGLDGHSPKSIESISSLTHLKRGALQRRLHDIEVQLRTDSVRPKADT